MPPSKELYIGLMSGTSIDGIDAALVEFSSNNCQLIAQYLQPLPSQLTAALHRLCQSGTNEIDLLAGIDKQLAALFAQASLQLLSISGYSAADITAIGSHGQTIRHHPELDFTLQIGDPNILATITNIDTIADFRRKDMALGGQGAPLVPAFHQAVFQHPQVSRAVVNIGGLANVTFLPNQQQAGTVIGYDTGPGNTLLDAWYRLHHVSGKSDDKNAKGDYENDKHYDENGLWARSGTVIEELLTQLLKHGYFQLNPPKSTGRELFNLTWLQRHLSPEDQSSSQLNSQLYSPADVQRSLVRFTAISIANEIKQLMPSGEVYICGGGAANPLLMQDIASQLLQYQVNTTAALGIDPDWVEAIAFAWLAKQHVHKQPGNIPAVTGASRPAILGSFYPAD
ncbi:MAG: anhydro-N-acetylmuramic acid kinase [Moritella sp.]|jgi:anhydro-N-acetylmuramic acid kinase